MNADLALQKAIYATLSADNALSALVDTRIHDNVPGDVLFPYLALGENETRDWPGGMEHRLTLYAFSRRRGRTETKRIVGAVNAALSRRRDAARGGRRNLARHHPLSCGDGRELEASTNRISICHPGESRGPSDTRSRLPAHGSRLSPG